MIFSVRVARRRSTKLVAREEHGGVLSLPNNVKVEVIGFVVKVIVGDVLLRSGVGA